MKNNYVITLILTALFTSVTLGQATFFTDYFDSYTAGQRLACQNGTDWITWTNQPCSGEDAMVTNAFFNSPSNAIVITPDVDLIKPIANLTDGNYSVVFKFYIPEGKTGYFNVLQLFSGDDTEYAMEVYLNAGGAGVVNAGGNSAASFTYTYNEWHTVEVRANMTGASDAGSFGINGTNIHTWTWSSGSTGTGNLKQLGGVDFYGATATDEMYIDNFQLWDNSAPSDIDDYFALPLHFALYQNYPNPFNPSTQIVYSVETTAATKLIVYNLIGQEVAVLVDEVKPAGVHSISFDAANLTSGTYLYKLVSGNNVSVKKMLLIK